MIEQLDIYNLGVIETANVRFDSGMNAITGETGAGKTMALTSLSLLMGGKAEATLVRAGASEAVVEATFLVAADSPVVDIVREAGGQVDEADGDQVAVILARHIPASGRSRAYAGGRAVPMAVLTDIAQYLVTVHGQADQIKLRSEAQQRRALDRFGGEELAQVAAQYSLAWQRREQAQRQCEEFRSAMRQAGAERLALEALIARVDEVEPLAGEEDELHSRILRLEHSEELRVALAQSSEALDGGDEYAGAVSLVGQVRQLLTSLPDINTDISDMAAEIAEVEGILADISQRIATQLLTIDADPEELNRIHQRRSQLRALQRELGMSIDEIIHQRQIAEQRREALSLPEEHLAQLEGEYEQANDHMLAVGRQLTKIRRAAADRLAEQVTLELHQLAMKDATFIVEMTERETPAQHGCDTVVFHLSAHAGARPLPLDTAASGGEMSRIMLALEVTLNADPRPDHTFIFDEVDAGIGGKTALEVGHRLARIGRHAQVLTVTHLAQVAADANCHIVVLKHSDGHTARTDVRVVRDEERHAELARMLSGHSESEAALTHAVELLQAANMP
ncbi:DNA repair protein RecN [Trueperella sp. LYQ143]|uniref:DNA repair protein RecN n=1 Tax=unclassified Trueperella TaxID=2630174 RepID=UPI003983560E